MKMKMKNKSSNTNINKLHIMKALKVKFKDVVSATNIISDHGILDNNLFQTASNYWLITDKEDVIEKELNRYFGIYGVPYEIEEIQES